MATVLVPPPFVGTPPGGVVEGLVDDVGVGGLEVEAGELDLRQLLSSETPTSLTSDEPPEHGCLVIDAFRSGIIPTVAALGIHHSKDDGRSSFYPG